MHLLGRVVRSLWTETPFFGRSEFRKRRKTFFFWLFTLVSFFLYADKEQTKRESVLREVCSRGF